MTNNIPIKIIQGIQEAGTEIAKQGIKTTEEAISTVITGKELVPDARPMSEEEMAKAKAEDEKKKKEEIENELKNIPGRDVTGEMKQVAQEEKSEEEKKQQEFLENIERQRREEEIERNNMIEMPGNTKREVAKTQFAPGKRKKQQPDATQMSQTSEFKGGKID